MFNEETILARLRAGESISTIAEEMANLVNTTNAAYEEEKAATAHAESQKKEKLQDVLDAFFDWLNTYYDFDITSKNLDAEQVIELIDSIKEYLNAVKDFTLTFDTKKPAAKANADDTINSFLKSMGW